jgi:hypothetical protein
MNSLPEKTGADLQKVLGLLENHLEGEWDAAVRAATRLLERHGLRWCEVLSLLSAAAPAPVNREPVYTMGRATCAELAKRPGSLRPWEKRLVTDLPAFPRISTKKSYILDEIAERVLGQRAA